MWWFIIYIIIGYLFYTVAFFYSSEEYEFKENISNINKYLIIVFTSIVIGLFWPIFLIVSLLIGINKYK